MRKKCPVQILKLTITVLLAVVILAGCMGNGLTQNNQSTISDDEPTFGWELSFSFPNGAPTLNKEAELLCTVDLNVKSNGGRLKVWVDLPEALQLVSGNLTWEGKVVGNPGDRVPTVKAIVKSVKSGNYVIRVHGYLPESSAVQFMPEGFPVFVAIAKDKSEWGINPPWALPPSMEPIPSDYPTPPTAEFSREPTSQAE
jgi:hypothetical protein